MGRRKAQLRIDCDSLNSYSQTLGQMLVGGTREPAPRPELRGNPGPGVGSLDAYFVVNRRRGEGSSRNYRGTACSKSVPSPRGLGAAWGSTPLS